MSTEKKLTAVEWLVNHFDDYGIDYGLFQPIIEQAKEKEKQQIIDAVINTSTLGENLAEVFANDYYSQTFKNE